MRNDTDPLLSRYESLILMSLLAQARDDIGQEDRAIDALDVVWAKLSKEQRELAEDINRRAIAWVNAKSRARGVHRFVEAAHVAGATKSPKTRVHIINAAIGRNDCFHGAVVGSRLSSLAPMIYSRVGSSSQCVLAG